MKRIVLNYMKRYINMSEYQELLFLHGIDIIVNDGKNVLIVLLLSFVFHRFWETALFIMTFSLLRIHSGGYHAETHAGCFCGYLATYFLFLGMIRISLSMELSLIIDFLCSSYIIINGPVEHKNNPLTEGERKRNMQYIIFYIFLFHILFVLFFRKYYTMIISVLFLNAYMMFCLKHSKNWRYYHES